MPENPYKHMRPRSTAGGIRKMQAKEIREMQAQWEIENYPPVPSPLPRGMGIWCQCGHFGVVPGDEDSLAGKRFRCSKCGRLV